MTFKTVTRNYIRNSSRRAFTLVELLVVIAIISILVGLLMPAVMNAQNEARRAQCQENMRNVAMALLSYESSNSHFPKYTNKFGTWYVSILEQLGSRDLYKAIVSGQISSETPHLAVLNCPSDSRIKCKQSYRINGGFEKGSKFLNNDGKKVLGYSGLSFSDVKVGLSDIKDGASNTVLIGENSNNRADWRTDKGQFQNCLMYTSDTVWDSKQYIINRSMDAVNNTITIARPSSRHRGVALVAFADMHVTPLKDSIQYNTYKRIMCPNDMAAKDAKDKPGIDMEVIDNNFDQ